MNDQTDDSDDDEMKSPKKMSREFKKITFQSVYFLIVFIFPHRTYGNL